MSWCRRRSRGVRCRAKHLVERVGRSTPTGGRSASWRRAAVIQAARATCLCPLSLNLDRLPLKSDRGIIPGRVELRSSDPAVWLPGCGFALSASLPPRDPVQRSHHHHGHHRGEQPACVNVRKPGDEFHDDGDRSPDRQPPSRLDHSPLSSHSVRVGMGNGRGVHDAVKFQWQSVKVRCRRTAGIARVLVRRARRRLMSRVIDHRRPGSRQERTAT